jgi:glutaredoxin
VSIELKEYFMIIAWGECPFCVKAKALLLQEGHEFEYIVLDHAPSLLKNYKSIYDSKTVPIIVYHNIEKGYEKIIGGYTDLVQYFSEEAG